MLLVDVNHLLDFIIAAQEDTAAIVNMLRYYGEHPAHLAIDCLASSYILG